MLFHKTLNGLHTFVKDIQKIFVFRISRQFEITFDRICQEKHEGVRGTKMNNQSIFGEDSFWITDAVNEHYYHFRCKNTLIWINIFRR